MNPVPDLGVQVRPTPQNVAALDQFRAERQRDFNWRNTFGQIPPADVLRETRDMISLTNRAIEQKMRLAAQTNHEAQNLYIKDQEFQEWQRQAPLRDELLKSQIIRRDALTARDMATQARANRLEAAQARYDTALETFLESRPDATTDDVTKFTHEFASRDSDARAIPAIRAAWTEMNQRIRQERGILAADVRQEGSQAFRTGERVAGQEFRTGERIAGQEFKAGEAEKGRQQRAELDSYRRYESASRAVLQATANRQRLKEGIDSPAVIKAADVEKERALANLEAVDKEIQAARGQATPPAGSASPMEGKRVRQKSTGRTGVIRNGEFIPDAS